MGGAPVNHVGIYPADLELSLRFYTEGVGLEVLFDVVLNADMEPLLGVRTTAARTIFLGSKESPHAGALELLDLRTGGVAGEPALSGLPQRGPFLISFNVPVQATLDRLAALGFGGTPRTMPIPGGGIAATVVDPDGVVVELLDNAVSFA